MHLIFITGKAGAGKTTTAYLIKKNLELSGKDAVVINYADLLKYICTTYFGWNGEKDEEGRNLLQCIGTEHVREEDPTFWVDFVKRFIKVFQDQWDYVIIGDCRFKNEISWARKGADPDMYDYLIRVERPGYDNGLTSEQQAHASETELDNVFVDHTIVNDGSLIDLDKTIMSWMVSAGIWE